MTPNNLFQREDEEDFGPGTALVLSLFAVLLLVGAMGWANARKAQGGLPRRLISMSEGQSGQSLFEAGSAQLTGEAERRIAEVVKTVSKTQYSRAARGPNHLQVIGYASPEGRNNVLLAENRAKAVRDYLVQKLRVPSECVVVASYADSHSPTLRGWLLRSGMPMERFRAMNVEEQRKSLGVPEVVLAQERRVEILSVFHTDSTCHLNQIPVPDN